MEFEKKNEIGFRIQKLRKERNISQETMGEILDIHANNISKIETGRSTLKLDTLIKIADYFEVTLDSLVNGEKDEICIWGYSQLSEKDKHKIKQTMQAMVHIFLEEEEVNQ